jgi:hypothetical protein
LKRSPVGLVARRRAIGIGIGIGIGQQDLLDASAFKALVRAAAADNAKG